MLTMQLMNHSLRTADTDRYIYAFTLYGEWTNYDQIEITCQPNYMFWQIQVWERYWEREGGYQYFPICVASVSECEECDRCF